MTKKSGSGLKKGFIQPLDKDGNPHGDAIEVLFYPNEYSVEKSNQYASTALPGMPVPIIQYVSGNSQTITMDLFFDTYHEGEDVRSYTKKLISLLDIEKELHAPPVCKFVWGGMIADDSFVKKVILERATQKFTMFLESGIPVRATVNVTFKEYKSLKEQTVDTPKNSSDRTKLRIVDEGDTLLLIANREYGNPGEWRAIAEANSIDNPRILKPGTELIIPPLR